MLARPQQQYRDYGMRSKIRKKAEMCQAEFFFQKLIDRLHATCNTVLLSIMFNDDFSIIIIRNNNISRSLAISNILKILLN